MANLNVAILGPEGYAKNLGKPGTTSDITLYNLKREDDTVTFIEPTRYPEKLAPLFFAVSLADLAILVVEEIGPVFGECILMLDCAELRSGLIILKNYITREEVTPLLKGTVLESYEFVEDDLGALRGMLLEKASAKKGACPSRYDYHRNGPGGPRISCERDRDCCPWHGLHRGRQAS